MIGRLLARFRKPAHIGWGGDYARELAFLPLWSPDGYEIR